MYIKSKNILVQVFRKISIYKFLGFSLNILKEAAHFYTNSIYKKNMKNIACQFLSNMKRLDDRLYVIDTFQARYPL